MGVNLGELDSVVAHDEISSNTLNIMIIYVLFINALPLKSLFAACPLMSSEAWGQVLNCAWIQDSRPDFFVLSFGGVRATDQRSRETTDAEPDATKLGISCRHRGPVFVNEVVR